MPPRVPSATKNNAKLLHSILLSDLEEHLQLVDDYLHSRHRDPYMPETADAEYKLLAERAITNHIPLLVVTPVQALYVDGFRSGGKAGDGELAGDIVTSPAWDFWQRSRLDARQEAVYRAAVAYGHSFVLVEKDSNGDTIARGLSPLRTVAVYDDPASDEAPVAVLHVTRWPTDKRGGKARMWDETNEYEVTWKHKDFEHCTIKDLGSHDAHECPVTRFAAAVDLDGRTVGVVEPMIPVQDRINQTVFDLLVAQTYNSFKVRWATGMAPPLKQKPIYDENDTLIGFEPVLDEHGQPIPVPVKINGKQMLFGEDEKVRFGTLDETPLSGYIEALDAANRHLAAMSQTPPTYLLGQIANLSAEALNAAEVSLSRKTESFRHSFGEAWERVFRVASQIEHDEARAQDFHGEVIWRDMESRALSQTADALGKLGETLGIPKRGLWSRVPGATQGEIKRWEELLDSEPEAQIAQALAASRGTRTTTDVGEPRQAGAKAA